jgi:hypothetical protein
VTTAESIPQTFSAVFGSHFGQVSVTAIAGYQEPTGGCIYVLGSSGTTVTFSGTPSINAACGVYINSTSSSSVLASGSPSITATAGGINMMGGTLGSVTYSPSPTRMTTAAANPLSGLTPPVSSGCTVTGPVMGTGTATLSPCVAGGIATVSGGIVLSGGTLTVNPGIYILGSGIIMSNGTLNATGGVMFYSPNGGVDMSGGTVNLTAPSSGAYQGIAIYQPSSQTGGITLSGGTVNVNGAIYVPGAALTFSGGGTSGDTTTIVCNDIVFSGSSHISAPATTKYSGSTGPTLLQ